MIYLRIKKNNIVILDYAQLYSPINKKKDTAIEIVNMQQR
jgi:hypothetical protein